MKLQTLKPRVRNIDLSIGTKPIATQRMRGGNLQRRNRMMSMRNPLCVHCEREGRTTIATQWDHIVPLCEGGAEHESNLQGLCGPESPWDCHGKKTALEAKRRATY